MKDQNQHQNKLFSALFNEDKKLSKEQLEKAKDLFQKKPLPEEEREAIDTIQELQYRLNARRTELFSKAMGTDIMSEDQEVKEHLDALKRTYSEIENWSNEIDLSFEDCELPPPDDLMSRIYPGRQNNGSSILYTYPETEVTGDDDEPNDPDEGDAEIDGARFKVSAYSENVSLLSTYVPVESKATLSFRLLPRNITTQYSELVIRAYLSGSYSGSTFDLIPFASEKHTYAWLKLNTYYLEEASNKWILEDSVKINVMEPGRTRYDYFINYSRIPSTSFSQILEARTDVVSRKPLASILVAVTAGAEALVPRNACLGASYFHGFKDINRASAALSTVLCAVDVGLQPATLRIPERRRHPLAPLRE